MAESAGNENRPLAGQVILLTRAEAQSRDVAEKLRTDGAEVLFQPAILISPPADAEPLRNAVKNLAAYDWVVFSSTNGVQYFMQCLAETGGDAAELAKTRLAAVGPGTAAALAAYALAAAAVPDVFRAEELAEAMISGAKMNKTPRFLLIRASRGREVLRERLTAAGGHVTQVTAYTSEDVTRESPAWRPEILAEMLAGRVDWVTVTSSAIAQSVVRLYGDALRRTRLVSISPLTSETLKTLGFPPAAEAKMATIDAVIDALRSHSL